MKTHSKTNPLPIKLENPNYEPWMTLWEMICDQFAVAAGYERFKMEVERGVSNGK